MVFFLMSIIHRAFPFLPQSDTDGDANGAVPAQAGAANGNSVWSEEASDILVLDYEEDPGPRHNLGAGASQLDFFWLMFPYEILTILVEETNRYARQCMAARPNRDWYDTAVEEMRAFLAINIIFGIRQLPRLWCYWSEDVRYRDPFVSSIMTIARFKNLSRYFHCRDTSRQPQRGDDGYDPLYKVRNILTKTKETFKRFFVPRRELSVDECMVGFKGRLFFKQYMPAKPTKWGIKVWTICDARTGYCIGYDVYTGKIGRRNPRKPLGFEVVDYLCSPHYGKGHHVYIDRFFNSIDIANQLLQNGTYVCGTIMTNRKGLPAVMKQKFKRQGEMVQLQQGNLVATHFHDKRTISLLSTNNTMGRDEEGRPHPLQDYNKFMGGVDKLDQQLAYYTVGRPGKKWWRYLMWHTLSTAIYNAFICWRDSPHHYEVAKGYDHMMFRMDIATALINGFCSRKLLGRRSSKQEVVAPESIKHHVIGKLPGRGKQCVNCSLRGKKTAKG